MSRSKSLFRQPGAQHFQVVHRSQRDPLIHDPEAGKHVLKQVERRNVTKGKTRAHLETELPSAEAQGARPNIGEAAIYGIYFDDTEYDYMQHLRPVGGEGEDEDEVEAVLLEAPDKGKQNRKVKGKGKAKEDEIAGVTFKDDQKSKEEQNLGLPASVLPSKDERPFRVEDQLPIHPSLQGLQPDMDPHLRQVLEALEDENFVDDGLGDDFFDGMVVSGERGEEEEVDFEWSDEALRWEGGPNGFSVGGSGAAMALGAPEMASDQGEEEDWQTRFARFKAEKKKAQAEGEEEVNSDEDLEGEEEDEEADEVGSLPSLAPTMRTARKRRVTASNAGSRAGSSFSMSSSAMFRNEGLSTLDERFDQVEKEYAEDADDSDEDISEAVRRGKNSDGEEDDDDEAPDLVMREDFDSIMDDFLEKYEIVGNKMKPVLGSQDASGVDKLEILRKALGRAKLSEGDDVVRVKTGDEEETDSDDDIPMPRIVGLPKDTWDVETILSTRTNLENHPRLLSSRGSTAASSANRSVKGVGTPKIRINPRTGFPEVVGYYKDKSDGAGKGRKRGGNQGVEDVAEKGEIGMKGRSAEGKSEEKDEEEDGDEDEGAEERGTIARPRNESKEERKARKEAVKAERQARRADKAAFKVSLANERKRQSKVAGGKAASSDVRGDGVGVLKLS